MSVLNKIVLFAIVFSISGCMSIPKKQIVVTEEYKESDILQYSIEGGYTITGQAFMRQFGGGIVTCAGQQVELFPATPFRQEVIRINTSGGKAVRSKDDPTADEGDGGERFKKRTICDAQGNFIFKGIPALPWFIKTRVTWYVGETYSTQGGVIQKLIDVTGDERILLTN